MGRGGRWTGWIVGVGCAWCRAMSRLAGRGLGSFVCLSCGFSKC